MSPKLLQISALILFFLAVVTLVLGLRSESKPTPEVEVQNVLIEPLVKPEQVPSESINEEPHLIVDHSLEKNSETFLEPLLPSPPSLDIAAEMRAIAVPINELSGIGGFLNPGNFVDIIYISTSNDGQRQVKTQQILRNIRVLAYGNTTQSQSVKQRAASTAVLEVPSASVPELVKAVNQGQITLALIGPERDDSEMLYSDSILDDSMCLVLVRESDRNFVSKVPCRLVDESNGRLVRLNE